MTLTSTKTWLKTFVPIIPFFFSKTTVPNSTCVFHNYQQNSRYNITSSLTVHNGNSFSSCPIIADTLKSILRYIVRKGKM